MATFTIRYHLQDGYVHNWLVAGPQAIPVPDLERGTLWRAGFSALARSETGQSTFRVSSEEVLDAYPRQ